jgi:hypothetical protein
MGAVVALVAFVRIAPPAWIAVGTVVGAILGLFSVRSAD